MQPPWRYPQTKVRPCEWEKILIVGSDCKPLLGIFPSLAKLEVHPVDTDQGAQLIMTSERRALMFVHREELMPSVNSDGNRSRFNRTG